MQRAKWLHFSKEEKALQNGGDVIDALVFL